jgi:predicted DNA-binding antitoxin AbrB/MazE fold protein
MEKTIRAKFSKGVIEPLEELDLEEGKEILVTIKEPSLDDRFLRAAGAWKGTIDAEKLIEDIYNDRLLTTRPEPKL